MLVSDLFLRFHIVKLGPRSFFGEHEVLFDVPSQYTYSASYQYHNETKTLGTEVYTCQREKFLRYSEEFPDFSFYMRQRATLRRALWRKIELEFEEKLAFEFA